MIIFDTETTGLIENPALPLEQQPRIIEIGAIKVNPATLKIEDELSILVNPGIVLEPIITKITGLTDENLKGQPRFARILPRLVDFWLGAGTLVAHNAAFDLGLLGFELERLDMVRRFPWCPEVVDTAEVSATYNNGRYMKLEKWYEHLFGKPAGQTHRALDDCKLLLACWRKHNG